MKERGIDIYNLNYILYSSFRHKAKDVRPLYACIMLYLYTFVRDVFKKFRTRYPGSNAVLVYAPSINNQRTIDPIVSKLEPGSYTYWKETDGLLPIVKIHCYSILHFLSFFSFYFKQSKEDKKLIRCFFDLFFCTIGRYIVVENFFKNNSQLRILIMANDHNQTNRIMIELAGQYDIQTIYTQHASVTDRFPALHFDYSFLDGLESFEKYQKVGDIRGRVFLSGSPRYDMLHDYSNSNQEENVVGIGLGEADKIEKVLELCSYISGHSINNIIVRPHPRTEPDFPSEKFISMGILVSLPSKENSLSFLSRVAILIANESGIHLDAAIMHKRSILFNFSDNSIMDWYGFIKQGLIKCCASYESVVEQLENHTPTSSEVIQYYYAAYNTRQEGNVGLLIAKLIMCLNDNKSIDDYISHYFIDTKKGYFSYR